MAGTCCSHDWRSRMHKPVMTHWAVAPTNGGDVPDGSRARVGDPIPHDCLHVLSASSSMYRLVESVSLQRVEGACPPRRPLSRRLVRRRARAEEEQARHLPWPRPSTAMPAPVASPASSRSVLCGSLTVPFLEVEVGLLLLVACSMMTCGRTFVGPGTAYPGPWESKWPAHFHLRARGRRVVGPPHRQGEHPGGE